MPKAPAREKVDTSNLNFDVDFNSAADVAPIAAAAWDTVRGDGDATFADSIPTYKEQLIAHAQSALKTGAQVGDTSLARFEQAVAGLRNENLHPKAMAASVVVAQKAELKAEAKAEAKAEVKQGKLPEDFPHRAALEAAGINTYAQARKAHESGFADVHGIGEAKGNEIGDALKN